MNHTVCFLSSELDELEGFNYYYFYNELLFTYLLTYLPPCLTLPYLTYHPLEGFGASFFDIHILKEKFKIIYSLLIFDIY